MKLKIILKESNENYSQEYADEYHFGKESFNNQKHIYSKSFELSEPIDTIEFIPDSQIPLTQKLENGIERKLVLSEVSVLKAYQGSSEFYSYSISKSILLKTHKVYNPKYNITSFYFYIKPGSNYGFPVSCLCADSDNWQGFLKQSV